MHCMQNYIHHHINYFSSICIIKYLNSQSEVDIYSKKMYYIMYIMLFYTCSLHYICSRSWEVSITCES